MSLAVGNKSTLIIHPNNPLLAQRPKTASPTKRLATPSPIPERSSTPTADKISLDKYVFTFPCKTCMKDHVVTYVKKETDKDFSISAPDGCFKAFEVGKSMLNYIIKELK